MKNLPVDDDAAWETWRAQWQLRSGTTYLNHGSFGPPPEPVRTARREWMERIDRQPMDFFARHFEAHWLSARQSLAQFLGTRPENLVLVENATSGMNVVAASLPLCRDDEVLLTDHEYGAVCRAWRHVCQRAGAREPRVARLPLPMESAEQVSDAIFAAVSARTRLIVVSHISSPTAAILPVEQICRRARQAGVAVCIDGPHAPAQVPLQIDLLDCDYYTASCHKWLSAPFGSGFLFVHPRNQHLVKPLVTSWGRVAPTEPRCWDDEFLWCGTRDPSALLAIPNAIAFLEQVGSDAFRARTHHLAQYARHRLVELTGHQALVPDHPDWYASMALVPLPAGDAHALQDALWQRFGIEVPVIDFQGRLYVRVSCHLYNRKSDIDLLVRALGELLA